MSTTLLYSDGGSNFHPALGAQVQKFSLIFFSSRTDKFYPRKYIYLGFWKRALPSHMSLWECDSNGFLSFKNSKVADIKKKGCAISPPPLSPFSFFLSSAAFSTSFSGSKGRDSLSFHEKLSTIHRPLFQKLEQTYKGLNTRCTIWVATITPKKLQGEFFPDLNLLCKTVSCYLGT